jgi:uncharacterized repeat protein (TIGR03803 family)
VRLRRAPLTPERVKPAPNGEFPFGGLIIDANGDLFGTTSEGGEFGDGTVFEIAKTASGYASTPTTLVSFDYADGLAPIGSLIADAEGNLFGTTVYGEASGRRLIALYRFDRAVYRPPLRRPHRLNRVVDGRRARVFERWPSGPPPRPRYST